MIRIVIAEDQGMLLGALRSLLSMEDDMEVVGLAKMVKKHWRLLKSIGLIFVLWILKCP